jgi:hypothetical protein
VPAAFVAAAQFQLQSERARRIVVSGALRSSSVAAVDASKQLELSPHAAEDHRHPPSPPPPSAADVIKRVRFQESPPSAAASAASVDSTHDTDLNRQATVQASQHIESAPLHCVAPAAAAHVASNSVPASASVPPKHSDVIAPLSPAPA